MGLKCGIVGLPNVGKSTIFNALTKAGIAAENYPFCTIEPNVGVVEVPDPRLKALSEIVHPERVVPAAVEFDDIADLDDEDKEMFLADMGMTEPGLDRVIRAGYDLLGLQTYFTAGVKEVRAWTIHKGDTAPQAAGVIHTDFERGFIRAQTIAYEDFIAFKGEKGAQEAGKMRAEGKDYIVQDGDVMNFLFNV